MRYSRLAILVFGAGALLGLAVVSIPLPALGRAASLTMATGIALLPVALYADWRRRAAGGRPKRRASARGKRRAPARRARARYRYRG